MVGFFFTKVIELRFNKGRIEQSFEQYKSEKKHCFDNRSNRSDLWMKFGMT